MLKAALAGEVSRIGRWLADLYALDLPFDPRHFVLSPSEARPYLSSRGPRTGVLLVEEEDELFLGLVVDGRDTDLGTLVEETSHLVCLAWSAQRRRRVSQLLLELQGEIDRFLFRRLVEHAPRPLEAPGAWSWARWADGATLQRYRTAYEYAGRYCRSLQARYPTRAHTPALLGELRAFYRATPSERVARAAG